MRGGARVANPATRVVMAGLSWGGMATLLAAPLLDDIKGVAVNAASGELGAIFTPLVRANMVAAMPGAGDAAIDAATQTAVASFRWVFEPADALYTAGSWQADTPALLQVVSAGAEDVSLHAKADQKRLADAFAAGAGAKQSTFLMADAADGATFCDDAAASLGSLLKPCAGSDADPANQMKAGGAYLGMQRQLVTFLATATSTGAVVCDQNPTVPCP